MWATGRAQGGVRGSGLSSVESGWKGRGRVPLLFVVFVRFVYLLSSPSRKRAREQRAQILRQRRRSKAQTLNPTQDTPKSKTYE